jgi:hypothetical protein
MTRKRFPVLAAIAWNSGVASTDPAGGAVILPKSR